jgi:hypothetical protein
VFRTEDSAEQGHSSALNDTELEKLFESSKTQSDLKPKAKAKAKAKAKKGKK